MGKTILAVVASVLVALGGAAAALYFYNRPTVLKVAVPQLAEDIRVMTAAEHIFAHQHNEIRLHLVPVENSAAGAALLESGKADLAVMRGDIALTASAQTLAILHRNAVLLIAPGGSRLRHVQDLRGKKIGVVHEVATMDPNARLLERILAQYEIPMKAVTLLSLSPGEARAAIEAGRVDAIFAAPAPQSGADQDIVSAIASISKKPPIFIPIKEAKAISKRFPALEPMEIVEGAFGGDPPRPAAAFDSLSVNVLLMARNTLRDDVAAEVTRLFFSHRGAIALAAPLANSIEAPSTDKGGAIPVHQGAVDYLDGTERGFFERYSDLFYIGAMLLSLVGSGAAALASRLNLDSHLRTDKLTEKLLEILQAARAAESHADLDGLERDVDDVLTGVLGDRKMRNVEAPSLHLVLLALDQTRRAITDRRHLLSRDKQLITFPPPRNISAAE
jgi:TRAP transporter TAXI family solute receptor